MDFFFSVPLQTKTEDLAEFQEKFYSDNEVQGPRKQVMGKQTK